MIRFHRVFVRHRLSTFHYEWDNLRFDPKDIDSEEIEIEDNDSENNDCEDGTYLFEPTLVPKFDAARDLDLGALGHEDETICKLMLWIYKTERGKQNRGFCGISYGYPIH